MKDIKEARICREQEFYAKCGELLGLEHKYVVPYKRKTRWNQRNPGNGRYKGFGVIRYFNEANIHVMCRKGSKTFTNVDAVYEWLQ